WARRRPVIAALLASLVLVSVLGFVGVTAALIYALEGWRQAREQRDFANNQTAAAQEARLAAEKARLREEEQRRAAEKAKTAEEELRQLADDARKKAETNVTFSRLTQARLEWRLSNLPASLSLLGQVEKQRRGWEWHYLEGLHHGELLTLSPPDLPVMDG